MVTEVAEERVCDRWIVPSNLLAVALVAQMNLEPLDDRLTFECVH